jgi:tetratricopeptide (TPR) repeat protein
MSSRRLWSALLGVVLWSGSAAAQLAEPTESGSADELVARGVELRKAGDDRGALDAFSRAYAVDKAPRARAQMALAEQALGRWVDAYDHLQEALRHGEDPWIREHEATLDKALGEIDAQLGSLEVWCNVPGAAISVDGRLLGRAPLPGPVKLVAGQSVLSVVAPDHFDVVRRLQIDAGKLSRAEVTLTRSAGQVAPGARPTTPAPDEGSSRDWLMYGSIGLAAVGVTAGVTGYVIREVNVNLYNDDSRCRQTPEIPRSEECPDEAAAFRRGELIAIVGFSSAAVFGALGLYLWLDRPKSTKSAALACGASLARVACAGTF